MGRLNELINKYGGGFGGGGWFTLKDDGDTATVRLLCKGENGVDANGEPDYDFPVYVIHKLDVDGSGNQRSVLCKENDSCELCRAGDKPRLRMFLQLVNLDEEDSEKRQQIWERGISDIKNLIGLTSEYGDLTKRDIKIRRCGKKGDQKTTYQFFPKDKSERDLPEPQELVGSLILDLDRDDQVRALEGRYNTKKSEGRGGDTGGTRVF